MTRALYEAPHDIIERYALEIHQLRAELATVSAERNEARDDRVQLQDELDETKAALEATRSRHMAAADQAGEALAALTVSRAETAAAKARIAELESSCDAASVFLRAELPLRFAAETALRELRERVEKALADKTLGAGHLVDAIEEVLRGQ